MKAQGSLEYLIIIAAVLAIAAVVVIIMSNLGASGSSTANIQACKTAAAQCKSQQLTSANYDCSSLCQSNCVGMSGTDIMSAEDGATACVLDNAASACGICMNGNASGIQAPPAGG